MKKTLAALLALVMLIGLLPQATLTAKAEETSENRIETLRFDDHVDMSGKVVEIIDTGTPTSYQVGYSVEENTVLDTAVVTLEGDTLVATGIGTAEVRIDGEFYDITVTAAPISLLLIIGQSNAEGMEGNANQSIVCPDGTVYSTYAKSNGLIGDAGLTVENAGNYIPSALTGTYSIVNVNGTETKLSAYPVDSLTESGAGKYGMDSGLAYEWVKQTGEKVWIVNAAHGASSITSWQKGAENYDQAVALFTACQQVLQKEIAAGHYTFSHMGYYWNQGCADETKTAEWYVSQYLAMHENLKADMACDMDSNTSTADNIMEFSNIVLVQAGHSTATGYRKGAYEDTSDSFFMTYKELELRGPRVAQIWMANNPELTDIHIVSTLAQNWVTMPDGSNGVAEYFQSVYANGTVDYSTQVMQSASWYTPTTPAAVKDSIHYNQIGYNEIGRESARNTLYILGILPKPDVKTTVTFLNWTGYELADTVKTSGIGTSDTLVVPLVYPCYESKTVTYTLGDGLSWNYYDLLDTGVDGGTLTASVDAQKVVVTGREYYSYRFELLDGEMVSVSNDTFRENMLTATTVNTYTLEDTILLKHNKEWIVEFNSIAADRFMALASSKSSTDGMFYFFKSKSGSGVLSIGEYKDGLYQNYGLKQSQINVDWTQPHVYRFQNVINDDGTNTIHIYVDGERVATATNLIINDVLQGTDKMYLSGKDFSFSSIGCGGFGLGANQMTYLAVYEAGQHTHTYTTTVTAPTCTEQGYTTYTCDCGNSYADNYVDAAEHTYENGICTLCDAEHPNLANYQGKVISILGDSISTFAGYIPTADGFNLEHYARYPQNNLLTDVNETWWMQVIAELDAKLGINESWRSTEVGNIYDVEVNSGYEGTKACMASLTRIQNLGSNGTPDVILFYGGTNDITQRRAVGSFDSASAPTEVDLTSVKWDTVADAYVAAIMRMQYYYPDAQIVAMLPTFTYKNTDEVIEEYNTVFAAICEHYGVAYVDLRECGITTADLPDGTHPNAVGMDYITEAVLDVLCSACDVEAGEHIVHSVTHELSGAESSLGYYKGVSDGKTFVTTITGENLTVTVTMGGVDITTSAYSDGVVNIPAVTEDIVITAKSRTKSVYEDHLQPLPEAICCGTNLWTVLTPENVYYTASGWGINATGLAHSVTILISPGDQLWATSFQASGTNGGNGNGIRITWFDEAGVLKSMNNSQTYTEFSANGYLTAPEGAVAVNVVMWNGNENNEVYVLNRDHCYEHGICTVCGKDSVTAALSGNTLSLSGELTVGTKILVSCYDGDRFVGTKILVWQGQPLQAEIPDGETVKLLFVDQDWLPLHKPICVK